jgi:hypothetical protein
MSIRERLEDAQILWNNDRKQGAWIQVLIAAAATSGLRFPGQSVGDAFRGFIREVTPTIVDGISPAVPGGIDVILNAEGPDQIELAQVVYKHLRCNLLHEAVMPADVRLSESRMVDGKLVADFLAGTPLIIPDFWVLHLAKAVANAPENAACAGMFG